MPAPMPETAQGTAPISPPSSASGVLRVGLVTMCATRDVDENVADATALVRQAAAGGATYVQTPEFTTLMEMQSAKLFAATKPEANNPALAHFQSLARELKIWLHIGSMGVLVGGDQGRAGESAPAKIANRSFLISPEGSIVARYDKIHMFDAVLGGGENFRESKNFAPGAQAVVVELPQATLGLSVCYDLRFPGLYRALAKGGAQILAIPSAFARQTGDVHWHPLLKARAIESGAYVLASHRAASTLADAKRTGMLSSSVRGEKLLRRAEFSLPSLSLISNWEKWPRRADEFRRWSMTAPSRSSGPTQELAEFRPAEHRYDSLSFDVSEIACVRRLVCLERRIRYASQKEVGDVSHLRLDQGGKGVDDAERCHE